MKRETQGRRLVRGFRLRMVSSSCIVIVLNPCDPPSGAWRSLLHPEFGDPSAGQPTGLQGRGRVRGLGLFGEQRLQRATAIPSSCVSPRRNARVDYRVFAIHLQPAAALRDIVQSDTAKQIRAFPSVERSTAQELTFYAETLSDVEKLKAVCAMALVCVRAPRPGPLTSAREQNPPPVKFGTNGFMDAGWRTESGRNGPKNPSVNFDVNGGQVVFCWITERCLRGE
ncbi:unnamed protein product, partial [Pleuronectes platessa]